MCHARHDIQQTKSERELLQEALNRPSVREHSWCPDGKVIIEAARKHLETLPMPPTPVKFKLYVDGTPLHAFDSREEAVFEANRYLRFSESIVAIRASSL
ncbi:MAG: hypothetical protein JSR91_00280 [Proteobacteria bacterium]|nr:hypothetical protein [Pseudomonadota bacterium]